MSFTAASAAAVVTAAASVDWNLKNEMNECVEANMSRQVIMTSNECVVLTFVLPPNTRLDTKRHHRTLRRSILGETRGCKHSTHHPIQIPLIQDVEDKI